MKSIRFFLPLVFLCMLADSSCKHHDVKRHDPYAKWAKKHGCGACLSHGTLVRLANGKDILIENLKVGDTILAFDRTTEKFVASRVLKMFQTEHEGFIKLNFDSLVRNGVEIYKKMSIVLSKDHPLWVQGKGWCSSEPEMTKRIQMMKEVKKMEVGDYCYSIKNSKMEGYAGIAKLSSIEKIKEPVRAYTIVQLENKLDCFIANGIVVGTEPMTMENAGE